MKNRVRFSLRLMIGAQRGAFVDLPATSPDWVDHVAILAISAAPPPDPPVKVTLEQLVAFLRAVGRPTCSTFPDAGPWMLEAEVELNRMGLRALGTSWRPPTQPEIRTVWDVVLRDASKLAEIGIHVGAFAKAKDRD